MTTHKVLCRFYSLVALSLVSTTLAGQSAAAVDAKPDIASAKLYVDVARAAGITHRHHRPILDHKLDNIMSWVCSVGAAAAAGDFDRDGYMDLYVTNSRKGEPNYLYRNNGDGTFTDVATRAGVRDLNGDSGTSMDCIWGDYDNDGWIDLYVVRWGNDALFRNKRDGTFEDVTNRCFKSRDGSPGTQWANGNGAIFLDYNLDGLLDIYVGNYFDEVDLWHLKSTLIMHDDFEKSRNGGRNFLYRQQPDGTFVEIAASVGVDDPGWTLAVGSADVNNDGWPDLYSADDFGPDQLFLNRRSATSPGFTNASESALGFDTKKGMNVDFGDFNNDGWPDIFVTNITTSEYLQEGNMLWYNNGHDKDGVLTLTDISLETGTYDGGWGWGGKFFDYDNDGDLDIISVNGFISAGEGNYWFDLASWTTSGQGSGDARNWPTIGDRSFSGYETTRLFRNDGLYTFTERAKDVGLDGNRDGRGVVVFDYDNDGDLDVYIANHNQPPHLYRNRGGDNHWLMVQLEVDPATKTNRDAVGARVNVMASGGLQFRERDGGNGYSGQSDPRLHFGLGAQDEVKLLEVRWPDGGLQYLENVPADRVVTIRQDPDRYATMMAFEVPPPKPWRKPPELEKKRLEMDTEQVERILSKLEERLRSRPKEYAPASAYRLQCANFDKRHRAIKFFKRLLKENPDDHRARLELGCAYVDKIPTCGGIAAIVSKGTLARQALDEVSSVIRSHDEMWEAYYCRAMNHLHWPRALLHSDDAVVDFQRCLALQKRTASGSLADYHVRTYIGLGDAYTKMKEYDKARKAWRDGLKEFPSSAELKERLAVTDNKKLLKLVESKRTLEQPIDTSLSFLDHPP